MNKDLYRECELKFKIQNKDSEKTLIKLLQKNEYTFLEESFETDFILDTKEYLCKKNHLLFRVRNKFDVQSKNNSIIITLKIKGEASNFQDNYEIEFSTNNINDKNIAYAIEALDKITDIKLSANNLINHDFENVLCYLFRIGFSKHEVMQKKRSYYVSNISQVTLDIFPNNIGKYLEIEATNEKDLYRTVNLLNLKNEEMERRSYGKLVLEMHNKDCIYDEKIFFHHKTGEYLNLHEFITQVLRKC